MEELTGGMSGAAVHRVPFGSGTAVRKRTTVRELEFYLEVAPHLPIRTPTLLDHRRDGDRVDLLLSDHGDEGPPAGWEAVVADLADLHSTPLRPARAAGTWLDLRVPDRSALDEFWSSPAERDVLDRVLSDATELLTPATALPAVPSHGDAHRGNVLSGVVGDDAGLVWLDWPEFGSASPAFDLGFCSARAVPTDVGPVPSQALQEYARRRGLDPVGLVLAVRAVELGVLVVHWPAFAGFTSADAVQRVRNRVLELGGSGGSEPA